MNVLRHVRILPLLVLVALLSFSVRMGEFVAGLKSSGIAFAQEEVHDAPAPPLPEAEANSDADKEAPPAPAAAAAASAISSAMQGEKSSGAPAVELPKAPVISTTNENDAEWQDAGDAEFEYSESQAALYKDLAARRKDLEKREKELGVRQALLEAGERELDQKLRELTAIKGQIEGLLQEQSDVEKARIDSLVKIYEAMKAEDAANIFNTLDMDILIRIMSRMSERKSSPIMAEMNPERARTVTILLAQQKQLPTLAGQ